MFEFAVSALILSVTAWIIGTGIVTLIDWYNGKIDYN